MKIEDFYDRSKAFAEFKAIRSNLNDAVENPRGESFSSIFKSVKEQARVGDVVAQDVVAYFYRDGVQRYLREDYLKYMHWEILSAAGGNMFAIDKLQFFLGYAYDEVVDHADFGIIKGRQNIDEYNYIFIIGQAICQQLVEDLGITPSGLYEQIDVYRPYRPEYFRDLRHAVDEALPKVIEALKA